MFNASLVEFRLSASKFMFGSFSYRAYFFLKLFVRRDVCTHVISKSLRTGSVLNVCPQFLYGALRSFDLSVEGHDFHGSTWLFAVLAVMTVFACLVYVCAH